MAKGSEAASWSRGRVANPQTLCYSD